MKISTHDSFYLVGGTGEGEVPEWPYNLSIFYYLFDWRVSVISQQLGKGRNLLFVFLDYSKPLHIPVSSPKSHHSYLHLPPYLFYFPVQVTPL